jgi:alpha-amylase
MLNLSLVIHNHQPVGNFDFVFATATERAYDPILGLLERHPAVRLSLHYTGPLWDWLLAHRPDHVERLRALVARGQVELLTGAYYEPILVSIPDADKVGQIRRMTGFLRQTFGVEPTGMWLAERVWEPHLPRPLAEAGVRYTLLDDTPFKMAGLTDDDLFGPYVTEEQGHTVTVFGNVMYLRYAIPWHPVEEVMDWLRAQASAHPGGVAVMGDDGEKFGLWPGTWDLCWGPEAWMDRFFAALERSADWLRTRPLGEVAAELPPLGRVYLPCASYEEMMDWALPPRDFAAMRRVRRELRESGRTDILRFVRGGLWRGFIARYDEVNQMHKKGLWVSRKVHGMPEGEAKARALDHVWAAQCNCGYWHGLFGGIYLFHIRAANYANLIAAESIADSAREGRESWVWTEEGDLDADGRPEIILNTDRQVLTFKPSYGGALVEWDWRAVRYNLLNTMTRRREGYHEELLRAAEEGRLVLPGQPDRPDGVRVKEPDVHTRLFHDWYRRAAFLDHFLHPDTTLDGFYRAQYGEQGDFVNQPYRVQVKEDPAGLTLILTRNGTVWVGDQPIPVQVEKRFVVTPGNDLLTVHYRLMSSARFILRFGVEMNWGVLGGGGEAAFLRILRGREKVTRRPADTGEVRDVTSFTLNFPYLVRSEPRSEAEGRPAGSEPRSAAEGRQPEVTLTLSVPATLWHFPLEAVSNSEAGYERVYQGTCTLAGWDLALGPDQSWEVTLQAALVQQL